MNAHVIQAVCREIYRRYPHLAGSQPRIQPAGSTGLAGRAAFLFVFKSQGIAAGGRPITSLLRVVVDQNGKILKISTSR